MFITNPFALSDARGPEKESELKDVHMLSWTESEIDFGHDNFVSFEPGQDLVKVNTTNDWDALVLYVRKEDILRDLAGGESKTQEPVGVKARTFVHGHGRNGDAKWRKVPLQIVSDKTQSNLAKATSSPPLFVNQDQKPNVPPELNFGDDHSAVHALLRNEQPKPKFGMKIPSKMPKASANSDKKEQPSSEDSVCESTDSTKLLLTKKQTIKALAYLNKVAEQKKKWKTKKPTTSSLASEKSPATEEESLPMASMQEILENHNPQRKLQIDEDDQTALLNHACGLRNFCTTASNQHQALQVDDHEILFSIDDSEEEGPPIAAIEVQEKDLDASVLTEPTLSRQDKMSRAVLTLLKTMHQKKNAALSGSPENTRLATLPEEGSKESTSTTSEDEDDEDLLEQKVAETKATSSLEIQQQGTDDASVEISFLQQRSMKEQDGSPAAKVPRSLKSAANAAKAMGKFTLLSPTAKKAVSHIQKNIQNRREKSVQNFAKNFAKTPVTKKEEERRGDLEFKETRSPHPQKTSENVDYNQANLWSETRAKEKFTSENAERTKSKISTFENASRSSSEHAVHESRQDEELRNSSSSVEEGSQSFEIDDQNSDMSSYEGVAAVEVDYIKSKNRRRFKNRRSGSRSPRSNIKNVSSESETMENLGSMSIKTGAGPVLGGIAQPKNKLTAPLSFDEQKVVDRIAREQSNLSSTSYDSSAASEDVKERAKGWRANRKALGAMLGKMNPRSNSTPREPSETLEKVVVEVGNSDNTVLEEVTLATANADPTTDRKSVV